ncbi:hypothetical protein [Psychrobacter sp. NPDC078631]|uniref:hypothetical protein n=1 Tax=Psychrobacter sp. NPDC078631 TaxID=3390666 RepID=UPI003D022D87
MAYNPCRPNEFDRCRATYFRSDAVNPKGRVSYANLGLWDDRTQAALDKTLTAIRQYSPMPIGVQLAHAGRKASTKKPWDGGGSIAPDQLNGW